MFTKKTIRDIDLTGKTVLLRADYNVPVEKGNITDDYRIKQSLPTIRYILEKHAKLIICSHLGRPDGRPNADYSLFPVAKKLTELLGNETVSFAKDCIGPEAEKAVAELQPGQVLLLENLRFHLEEEQNNEEFAGKLASLAEVFVQDGFGVVHRAHASTDAVTHYLPSVAGLLLEKEVDTITNVMQKPERPLMAVIGGAKISDKIDVINKFIDIADIVAVGGAMSNTFMAAQGIDVAKSLYEKDDIQIAKDIMKRAHDKAKRQQFIFYVPQDAVVADKIDKTAKTRIVDFSAHVIADIENYPKRPPRDASEIAGDEMILDIGPFSGSFIAGSMQLAKTVVWNGSMGVTETQGLQGPVGPFAHGTDIVVEAILGQFGHRPYSLVGGGDTVGYIESQGLTEHFDHVSTGGGASLELMAGRTLPGVAALLDKEVVQ
ncbi:MAG TPA: phosphoglycerate kinase [Candidatus Saccharimonadales bacterium]|nr:phosphoglycerate kinase [Candidatus Saccharimonadales bacterium]